MNPLFLFANVLNEGHDDKNTLMILCNYRLIHGQNFAKLKTQLDEVNKELGIRGKTLENFLFIIEIISGIALLLPPPQQLRLHH